MALNTFKCNHLTSLHFKGLTHDLVVGADFMVFICSVRLLNVVQRSCVFIPLALLFEAVWVFNLYTFRRRT